MTSWRRTPAGARTQPIRSPGAAIFDSVDSARTRSATSGSAAIGAGRLAAVAQLAVRVVLEDPEAALGGDARDLAAAPVGQRATGGVLERRHRVEEHRPLAVDRRLERLGQEPVVVAGDRHEPRARQAEGLERGEVGRLLDEHDRPGFHEQRRDEGQRLLGAARDDQLVGRRRQPAARQQAGDPLAQDGVALGRRVLERAPGDVVAQRPGERRAQPGGVEQPRIRQPAGERDDAGPLGQREDVAHGTAGDPAQPRGRPGRRGAGGAGPRHRLRRRRPWPAGSRSCRSARRPCPARRARARPRR